MAKYRIYYWPGSGLTKSALTKEQIESTFEKKCYEFEAESDEKASRIAMPYKGVEWETSDGVLLVRVENEKEVPAFVGTTV